MTGFSNRFLSTRPRSAGHAAPPPKGPWVQTASGRAFDLINPTPEMVDFEVDIPEALARIARFNGHVRSGAYSVAQHSVLGADAIFAETGSKRLAALFLLHDAHEAYIGDIATPVAEALAVMSRERGRTIEVTGQKIPEETSGDIAEIATMTAIKAIKHRIDAAIHAAAQIPMPDITERSAIKRMDLRMLATERRQLMGPCPHRWHESIENAEPVRLRGAIRVQAWPDAADSFRAAFKRYIS